jgi:hypothetical protein
MTFGCWPRGQAQIHYMRIGGGFPQVRVVVSFMNLVCMCLVLAPKALKLCTNQFVIWFVQVHVSN